MQFVTEIVIHFAVGGRAQGGHQAAVGDAPAGAARNSQKPTSGECFAQLRVDQGALRSLQSLGKLFTRSRCEAMPPFFKLRAGFACMHVRVCVCERELRARANPLQSQRFFSI